MRLTTCTPVFAVIARGMNRVITHQPSIDLRWSGQYAFMKCQRRYRLEYIEGWHKRPSVESRARFLGSAVHAGLQDVLHLVHANPDAPEAAKLRAARDGMLAWVNEHYDIQREKWDYERREWVSDDAYHLMVEDVRRAAYTVLAYQVPRLGFGSRYLVPTVGEVLGRDAQFCYACETYGSVESGRCTRCGKDSLNSLPAIEWNFNTTVTTEEGPYNFTGTIDAVLKDAETGEYVVADWKVRQMFHDERLVDLDGQLKFYAAIINYEAAVPVITKTLQIQLLNRTPKPAKLTEKTRRVSLAAIASTWEVWSQSVAALGLDPEQYRAEMEPKLQSPEHYTRLVETPVPLAQNHYILANALQIGHAIRRSIENDSFPGIPSSMGCQYCPFKNYCRVLEVGGDTEAVLELEYEQGEFNLYEEADEPEEL